MTHAPVNPEMLRWTRERALRGLSPERAEAMQKKIAKFKDLPEWEAGRMLPTLGQAEKFAKAVHAPISYLFLSEPLKEEVSIPDFRTLDGREIAQPSLDLLDTLYACRRRQHWYREFIRKAGEPDLDFVGSVSIDSLPEAVADQMREVLRFNLADHRTCSTWTEALRMCIKQAEEARILVMVNGVVLNNTRRSLNPEEFRGFALCDSLAPLVFINGKDTKAAQMFTLAHELAHIWLGTSALSNLKATPEQGLPDEEVWCNAVAAELLVPLKALRPELQQNEPLTDALLLRLACNFKVSSLVILRRLLDAQWLTREQFDTAWAKENVRLRAKAQASGGGGNFYNTAFARVGKRFAHALVVSTLEGQTLRRDAFRLLGIKKTSTFDNLVHETGVLR